MDWKDSVSLVLPLVHVVNKNLTQLVNRDNITSPITIALNEQLKRFSEYGMQMNECSLFPAVRDLLMNFTLPNEMPLGMQSQQIPNLPTPMGMSPNPMLHSPMQPMNQNIGPPSLR